MMSKSVATPWPFTMNASSIILFMIITLTLYRSPLWKKLSMLISLAP